MKPIHVPIIVFISFFISFHFCAVSFQTLQHAQTYASMHKEHPASDNDKPLNPDYTSYHKKNLPSSFDNLLTKLRIKQKLPWKAQNFKELLQNITEKQNNKGLTGRFIQKMKPQAGSVFIMWGDIQGAYHSLVRDLQELTQQDIVNESFKIIKPHHYFIFNGDLINRSPYSLETLTLVMRLMEVNPDNVIYIRGNHEDKEHWRNFGLRRELEIRAKHLSDENVPLNTLVNNFFNTLPLALYLIPKKINDSMKLLRISHHGRKYQELDEKKFAHFFHEPVEINTLATLNLANSKPSDKTVMVKVIIKGESRHIKYRSTDGLQLLEKDRGATAWSLLSSPTSSYKKLYGFSYDAFTKLTIEPNFNDWTLTLYNQDSTKKSGFSISKTVDLLSGRDVVLPIDPSKKKEEIRIGSTMDLSKGIKTLSNRIIEGLQLVLRTTKINGKNITLTVLDDKYNPQKARKNIETLIKQNIDIILSPMGSPTTAAYLDLVRDKKVLVLFPQTGAPVLRKPDLINMLHFRASYADEGKVLTQYAIKTLRTKKIALFYQDDAYGIGALEGAREALKEAGIQKWTEVSYKRNEVNFTSQVAKIKKAKPEAIGLLSTIRPSEELIRQLTVQSLFETKLFGLSDLGIDIFKNFIKEKGLKIILANGVPNPVNSKLEIVKEFRQKAKKNHISLNTFNLEGYINASIFVDILNKIDGPITKDKIVEVTQKMKNYNFKGLDLNFNDKTRELSNILWLDTGEKEWEPIEIIPQEK